MQDMSFIKAQIFISRSELQLLLVLFHFEAALTEAEGSPGTCEEVGV